MAIVLGPALSLRARGKVGAVNYSENRGVAVARGGYSPVQPNTAAQVVMQGYFTAVVQSWKNLTSAQVKLWRDEAAKTVLVNRLGQKYQPTAYNLYCARNMNLKKIGSAMVSGPGKRQSRDIAIRLYSNSVVSGYFTLWVDWMINTSVAPIVRYAQYAGPFDSANRQPQSNDWNNATITPKNTEYVSKSGFTSGKYYWARSQCVYDNGETSLYMYVQHLIT